MHKNVIPIHFLQFIVGIVVIIEGSDHGIFLNKWAVQIHGGHEAANAIASEHGFKNLGKIGSLDDVYVFEHHEIHKRSLGPSRHHHSKLLRDPQVKWAEQQVAKKRVKRDNQKSAPPWKGLLNDNLWSKMWYLHGGADGGHDMNVIKAWQRGYTGKGVVVTILDDGIEHSHPDLKPNYDPLASNDINGHDNDPMPRYDSRDENRHGTRCAGEVAAVANNSKCVVGLAYNANIGGVRMLDGDVSDLVEASALGHNPQHVDIYSASWGPDDNGKVVDGPAKLARDTFVSGVLNGRKGKGSIFVWASGNGGSLMDSCACDGYTNSIFTLSVSSVSEHNTKPWYLEECASTLATTYSSGENYHDKKILTTDLHGRCTEQHTGTSASAPLAAALVALALEANPELTWRDMQYLVVVSSNNKPFQDGDWETNGVGRKVSHRYGYGLMDADMLVRTAERWTTLPSQHICSSQVINLDQPLNDDILELSIDANGCQNTDNYVKHLEHVQAKVTLRYNRRGDLEIYLISPSGTRSKLLPHRKNDHLEGTFSEWPFMSVFFWGEDPTGTWKLEIVNVGTKYNHAMATHLHPTSEVASEEVGSMHVTGIIEKWQLILYGTAEEPVNLKPEPKYPPNKHPGKSGDKENSVDKENETSHSGEDSVIIDSGKQPGDSMDHYQPSVGPFTCNDECEPNAGCTGPGIQDCLACKHAKLMPDGICVSVCPPEAYFSEDTATCHMCETPCNKCNGPDIMKDCLGCIQGYYYVEGLGQCLAQCREGFYEASHDNICLPCGPGCTLCSGRADYCSLCQPGYDLEDNACVMHCAPMEFKDQNNRCEPCHQSCSSCYGPGADHCSRCVDDLLYQNGSCIPQCMQGYFILDTTEGIYCQQCHGSCLECRGPDLDQCTACYDPLKLAGGVCLEGCPLGGFDTGYGVCGGCHMTCNTCNGPGPGHCLSCDFGHWLQDGHCVSMCKTAHYPFEAYTDMGDRVSECLPCHPTCESCRGGLVTDCITCKVGLVLTDQGDCLTECPLGYYSDEMNACLPCREPCMSCSGPSRTDCTSCDTNLALMVGECLLECPDGFYSEDRVCQKCHHACQQCFGAGHSQCTLCSTGFIQQGDFCVDETETYTINCDIGQYFDKDQGSCLACHSSCSSCVGQGPTNCLSCTPPHVYYPHSNQCLMCCSTDVISECCDCIPGESICRDENVISQLPQTSSTSSSPSSKTAFITDKNITQHHSSQQPTSHHQNPSLSPTHHPSSDTTNNKITSRHPLSPSHSGSGEGESVHITTKNDDEVSTTTVVATSVGTPTFLSRHWANTVTFLVFACVFSVGVFFLIFGLLQARSSEQLCWGTHKYQPVPTLYQNGSTTKVRVADVDYMDDDDEEEALYQKA